MSMANMIELNDRSQIEKMIHDVFDGMETNSFSVLGKADEPMWETPLIGIAAGDDPYYSFLKEHIGTFHMMPAEAFAQKYQDVPDPSKLRIISISFPQATVTKNMQTAAEEFPCDYWLVSRGEWEPFIAIFCQRLEEAFAAKGIRSVCPDLLTAMKPMKSDTRGFASTWSHRHTAYAAGLGTFGLSDGLITTKGKAVRFTSIIVEMDLPVNGKVSEDPYGWCTRCGACIGRCPADAILPETGHEKDKCEAYGRYCVETLQPKHEGKGYHIKGCGLCQVGVPCSDHPPQTGTIQYRPIQPSDDAQLAQLVRRCLKDHDLDIPGTAYFDLQLDRLYEYYTADPEKRNYIVAVNEPGRVIGGIGIDAFDKVKACAELQKLYVSDDYRRKGIGRHLIRLNEAEALKRGYERIYLETHSNLQAAMKLYECMGYESIQRPAFSIHETMDHFLIKELTK